MLQVQNVIFHSHSRVVFTDGLRCMVNMVGAASEVTNRNAAVAVDTLQWLMRPCIYEPCVVLTGEVLASLHWYFKLLT